MRSAPRQPNPPAFRDPDQRRFVKRLADPRLLVICITAIGTGLRLWSLETAQYEFDDWVVEDLAWRIVHEGARPLGVFGAHGLAHGPAGPYVLAVVLLFTNSHIVVASFVALLSAASIPLFYLTARDVFSSRAGVMASLLLAVNPWAVASSRRLWLQALVVPAAIFTIWAFHRAIRSRRFRAWILLGVSLAVGAQTHLSALSNIPSSVIAVLPFLGPIGWPRLLAAGGAAALVLGAWANANLLPFVLHISPLNLSVAQGPAGASAQETGVDRALLLVTGVGYQTLTGQGARLLDATQAPFQAIDVVARTLAVLGWGYLLWTAWSARQSLPRSGTCLLATSMVFVPAVGVSILVAVGRFDYPYWWYFVGLVPPLILGMAALAARSWRRVPWLGPSLCAVIAGAQLLLVFPFLATQGEYWPRGGYCVAWEHTNSIVQKLRQLTAEAENAFVVIGGAGIEDCAQGEAIRQLFARESDRGRIFDSRDGVLFRQDNAPLFILTTNDDHVMTRFLDQDLQALQVLEQRLPGPGWTRRIFTSSSDSIYQWAETHLQDISGLITNDRVLSYERIALLLPGGGSDRHRLGILWRLEQDPPEPFITDYVFLVGGQEIHRERHIAYPVGDWRQGDWFESRVLNLFELPTLMEVDGDLTVRLRHTGIRTGRPVGQPVDLPILSSNALHSAGNMRAEIDLPTLKGEAIR